MGRSKKEKIINYGLVVLAFLSLVMSLILVLPKISFNSKETVNEIKSVNYKVILKDNTTLTSLNNVKSSNIKDINLTFTFLNENIDITNVTIDSHVLFSNNESKTIYMEDNKKFNITFKPNFTDMTAVLVPINYKNIENTLQDRFNNFLLDTSNHVDLELILNASNNYKMSISLNSNDVSISELKMLEKAPERDTFKLLLIVGFLGLSIVCVIAFVIYRKYSMLDDNKKNEIVIFKFNKDILVSVDKKTVTGTFIDVTSFKELLKIQGTLGLPILYYDDAGIYNFVIKTNGNGYRFILKK